MTMMGADSAAGSGAGAMARPSSVAVPLACANWIASGRRRTALRLGGVTRAMTPAPAGDRRNSVPASNWLSASSVLSHPSTLRLRILATSS
ncbi:hypothetical protein [Sphingobium yanoikuyae]|uniref:hypothetical protein n=1 Tax=Sphingobium yanoikuyae TaxID=13690 RepID=UPI00345E8DAE